MIHGDANMAEWASYLKIGTTSLVLSMIEDVFLTDPPELADPVRALAIISSDPTLAATVPLMNGRQVTALDLQQWYLQQAIRYCDPPEGEEEEILGRWTQALSELASLPRLAIGKLDWLAKKSVLEPHFRAEAGWNDTILRALDFKYHSLRPDTSLYTYLVNAGVMERIVTDDEVNLALTSAPPFTRASVRTTGVRQGATISNWDSMSLSGQTMVLDDPFAWVSVSVLSRLGISPTDIMASLARGAGARFRQYASRRLPRCPRCCAAPVARLRFRRRCSHF